MQPEESGRWIFSVAKHLKVFAVSSPFVRVFAIRRSAMEGELLLRIRGRGTISGKRIEAFATDIGIAPQELPDVLVRLESTGLISIQKSASSQNVVSVQETILTEQEVYRATAVLFELAHPSDAERAILPSLDLMSRLPLTEEEAITQICKLGFSEEESIKSLELQEAFHLVQRQQVSDLGISLLYNEYLWGHKIERVGSLLAKLPSNETEHLLSLMEEVRSAQGQSLERLTSAPQHIIALAANKGILDTTTITTSNGKEKTFAFSPHFYGYRTGTQPALIIDPADHVRLFIASMAYGVNYSEDFRLYAPLAFVRKLLREGEAGDATPILRDYVLLERQGIVAVKQSKPGRGTFILQKRDIVEKAFDVMENGSLLAEGSGTNDVRSLISQQDFRSPETNRLTGNFGQAAGDTRRFDHDLMAAIRESAQRGTW
jgi:hypothetical protein